MNGPAFSQILTSEGKATTTNTLQQKKSESFHLALTIVFTKYSLQLHFYQKNDESIFYNNSLQFAYHVVRFGSYDLLSIVIQKSKGTKKDIIKLLS